MDHSHLVSIGKDNARFVSRINTRKKGSLLLRQIPKINLLFSILMRQRKKDLSDLGGFWTQDRVGFGEPRYHLGRQGNCQNTVILVLP